MIISEWDRDLIRRRLNNYLIAKARGKKLLPLKTFLHNLLMSGVTNEVYPYNGDEPDFKEEALRRFRANTQHTEDSKVLAIQQFLIHEKFLKEKELGGDIDPDYLPGLLAVHDYLGNKSEEAIDRLTQLHPSFFAKMEGIKYDESIQLNILLKDGDAFFRLEEICKISNKNRIAVYLDAKDVNKSAQTIRRGYGFVSTQNNNIYLFLHDYTDDNPIVYIQVEIKTEALWSGFKILDRLTFVRSGDLVQIIPTVSEEPNPAIILNGVLCFSSDPAKAMVNKEYRSLHTTEQSESKRMLEKGVVPIKSSEPDYTFIICIKAFDTLGLSFRFKSRHDVNVQDEHGLTALHHAAALGARPCIRILVNSGKCDYLIQDNKGRYASDLAIGWARDYGVGRLLTKHQLKQAHERGVPAWLPSGPA